MKKRSYLFMISALLVLNSVTLSAINPSGDMNTSNKEMTQEKAEDQLLIVWTSGNPEKKLLPSEYRYVN